MIEVIGMLIRSTGRLIKGLCLAQQGSCGQLEKRKGFGLKYWVDRMEESRIPVKTNIVEYNTHITKQ